jgi:NADH-quinone oxidoreductase subunit F
MAELILTKRMLERPDDSWTLAGYEASGGYATLRQVLNERTPAEIRDEVKASGLRGRGGAGFPTGVKWGFLPEGVYPRYLVINGDEGEVGTFKDRMLMERDPHQLIEGILISCFALEAEHAFIYARGELLTAIDRLEQAVAEATEAGYVGTNICGTDVSVQITVHRAAGAYICGEETALLSSLEGYRGWPRLRPPFPAVKGLYAKPTIVNNVETISNVPWIARNGGAAYAAMGTEKSPGTRLFCLSGHVNRPGNYEVELGTTFDELFTRWGRGIRDGNALKAFVPGGASAPWFDASKVELPLDMDVVMEHGSMLGSGAIMVMDETVNVVKPAWRLVKFFAHESCGQCTPCREGTDWLEEIMERMLEGRGRAADLDLLIDVCDNISPGTTWPPAQTTICPLGPSATAPIWSTMRLFREDYEALLDPQEAAALAAVAHV